MGWFGEWFDEWFGEWFGEWADITAPTTRSERYLFKSKTRTVIFKSKSK